MDERDILGWANFQFEQAGCEGRVRSFRDPALRSGVFVLEVLRAVAPECVAGSQVPTLSKRWCAVVPRQS